MTDYKIIFNYLKTGHSQHTAGKAHHTSLNLTIPPVTNWRRQRQQ